MRSVFVNDLKPQDSDRPSNPAGLFKYRIAIFLAAAAVLALVLALYLTGGGQMGQAVKPGILPSTSNTTPDIPTAVSSSPALPISPVSPVSPLSVPSKAASPSAVEIESMAENGLQLYRSGDYTAALEMFDTVVKADPGNPAAYDARGSIYAALNDNEHALSDYNRAIQLDPSFAQAYYNRGRVYSLLKRYDEAIADLEKSIELDAIGFSYRANGNIGLIYYKQGQYDKALAAFNASISSTSAKADAFYLRGETYTAMGKYDAAIADYQSAIERFASYDLAYQGLGYAYYKTAQYDKAAEALNQAIGISPDSPTAHLYLALVDVATDKPDSATGEVSRAAAAFSTLPPEEQQSLYSRVTADLKAVVQQNPGKAKEVEAIIAGLPQPK
jgi:tetratricopeptide (TPR) repeat protein